MFKILIALKTRNPIIIRPHSSAVNCSIEAAKICYDAAIQEDAPENCIQLYIIGKDYKASCLPDRDGIGSS